MDGDEEGCIEVATGGVVTGGPEMGVAESAGGSAETSADGGLMW